MVTYRNVITPSLYGPMIINRYDTHVGQQIGQEGSWQPSEVKLLQELLQIAAKWGERTVVLDIGANIGSHTLALARMSLPNVEIHAFEAQRLVFMMLAGTMAINSIDNVFIYHRAVSDVTGNEIRFAAINYNLPANFAALELGEARNRDFDGIRLAGKTETVVTLRIDDLNLTDVRLIKVDVEGMEYPVLTGARQTIVRFRPFLYLEKRKTDFDAVQAFLVDLNYIFYTAFDDNIVAIPAELNIVVNYRESL